MLPYGTPVGVFRTLGSPGSPPRPVTCDANDTRRTRRAGLKETCGFAGRGVGGILFDAAAANRNVSPFPTADASQFDALRLAFLPWPPHSNTGGVPYRKNVSGRYSTPLIQRLMNGLATSATTPAAPIVSATFQNSASGDSSSRRPATKPANTFPKAAAMNHTPII